MYRLMELRKINGMTQHEVAEIAKVTQSTYGNWERGDTYPDSESLILLSRHYRVSIDYILCNDFPKLDPNPSKPDPPSLITPELIAKQYNLSDTSKFEFIEFLKLLELKDARMRRVLSEVSNLDLTDFLKLLELKNMKMKDKRTRDTKNPRE